MVRGQIAVENFDLLDVEASDDSEDDSYDSAAEDEFWNGRDPDDYDESEGGDGDGRTFPKFGELPPELRDRIWELACVDLNHPRILHFQLFERLEKGRRRSNMQQPFTVYAAPYLTFQTVTARTIMAVNRAARRVALRAAPDTLKMNDPNNPRGYACVHFNKEHDVVMIDGLDGLRQDTTFELEGFSDDIKQLAIRLWDFAEVVNGADLNLIPCLKQFPNLNRIFIYGDEGDFGTTRNTIWCGSDFVHVYDFVLIERFPTSRLRMPIKVCWPDVDNHPDYAKVETCTAFDQTLPPQFETELSEIGIQAYPMIMFEGSPNLARFERLETKWQLSLGDVFPDLDEFGDSSSIGDDDDDLREFDEYDEDEYDSDGIYDGPIEEATDSEEEEEYSNEHRGSVLRYFPPDIFDRSDNESSDESEGPVANFSSPEPESGDDEDEASTKGHDPESTVPRSNKRRIVTDSDDEEAPETSRAKRVRTSRVVTSDSEEDDEAGGTTGDVSSATVKVEDDDSSSESEDSEDDAENRDDEEEEPVPKRKSLAERLRIHREAHPVSSSDDGESDDNDEDDDEDDDEESGTEDGLIDGIAEESDDGSDDSEEDDEE